jgi:hypothetical protein
MRLIFYIIVIVFLALLPPAAPTEVPVTLAETPNAIIPSTFFGMHVAVSATSYSTPILPPIAVGATAKGVVTNWPYLERSRGVYTWGALDLVVAFAKNHNVPVFEGHQYEPAWAVSDTTGCQNSPVSGVQNCPAPPTTEQDWIDFLTAMVNRYKTTGIQTGCTAQNPQCNGVIQMYEGWNEPPYPNPMPLAKFVTLETDFLNTVRANDPGAQVCSPAFIIDPAHPSYAAFMNNFLANGGTKTWDCYDFHINDPAPEGQISKINQFKSILNANGIAASTATIYATEAGRWEDCGTSLSDPLQQAYIARIELLYWSNNVKRHYWYAYDTCGTLSNQPSGSTLTPAGIAYGNVEDWMVGATMTAPCAANGTVWTCGLSRPNGYQALAVWNTAATSTFVLPKQYTQYQDLIGNTHSINVSVTIGPQPILLTSGAAPRTNLQATVH